MSLLVYFGGGALLAALLRWWRPRPGWVSIAAYWFLAGLFFVAPLTTPAIQAPTDIPYLWRPWVEMVQTRVEPANPLLGDIPFQMIPFRALVRSRLLHLDAPLWANEVGTGEPLLGDAQSAPFSPLGLIALPLPVVRSLPVMAALKLFLSLLLTDALLATLGAGTAGAAFGALAFTFSVYSICWAFHPPGMAAAWLPGVALGLVLVRRGERGALGGLVACAAGMTLSGHPETVAHTALAALLIGAWLLLAPAPAAPPGGRRRFLLRLAAAAAITAGLTAPVLLPVLEALPEALRSEALRASTAGVQPSPFAWADLRVLVDPLVYGSPRDGDWHGPWNYNELCSGYAGLLALAVALAAAAVLRGRLLAILAAGAAGAAAAFSVPPILRLVNALPLLDHAANGRLRLLWVLAVAVVAGLGVEPLAARRAGRYAVAFLAAVATLGLAAIERPGGPWQQAWWWATLAGGTATALAFLWHAVRPPPAPATALVPTAGPAEPPPAPPPWPPAERAAGTPSASSWLPWLAVACLALDLGLLEARFLPVLPARFDLAPPPVLTVLLDELHAHPSAPFRVIAADADLLPNLAAFYGLWDPRADDPMQPARAALVVGRSLRPRYKVGRAMLLLKRPFPAELLSLLAVRYVLTHHGERLPPPWRAAWEGQGGMLWRNDAALPLFVMPAAWRLAADPRDALAATLANRDFAAVAVVESPGAGEHDAGIGATAAGGVAMTAAPAVTVSPAAVAPIHPQAGVAHLLQVAANGFVIDTAAPAGGLVASSVTYCRGWQLSIDGAPAPLLRVNAGFLGFLAPPGAHRARLEFRPAGWVWGLRLCGLTLVVLLLTLLASLRRSRATAGRAPGVASPPKASRAR